MKIGAVIVTFNPQIEKLKQVIDAVCNQVTQIKIIDNASQNCAEVLELSKLYENARVVRMKKNWGIAKAQNIGFRQFSKLDYGWVLTLDQDTVIPTEYVHTLQSEMPLKKVGIITGAYIDLKWSQQKIAEVRNSRRPQIQKVNEEISSGNVVRIDAWKSVNGFDEDLFIDYVDFDFDYKLIENGFNIYRVNSNEFEHEIGSSVKGNWKTTILFLNKHELFDHSVKRLYYMNRNRIIIRKRHPAFGSPVKMVVREILNLREVLVMSSPRGQKFKNAVIGIFQGIFYK